MRMVILTVCYWFKSLIDHAVEAIVDEHFGEVVNIRKGWSLISQVTEQSRRFLTRLFFLKWLLIFITVKKEIE